MGLRRQATGVQVWAFVGFGVGVALLTWDRVAIAPGPGIDPSWILGLNLAAERGLDHGTEVVFTYGPLGFLAQPMVVDGLLATLGGVYLFATRAALAGSLLFAARRSFSWPVAIAVAVLAAVIVPRTVGSVTLALSALWCLIALRDDAPPWTPRLVTIGGGALAAVEAMVKLNVGLTVLAVVAITAIGLPGPRARNLLTIGATFAACFAALWFAAGQTVGNLDDYLRTSYEIVAGYQRSMQLESPAVSWDWLAALTVVGGTVAMLIATVAAQTRRSRIATVALAALLCFSLFKYGFVRHDAGHVAALFGVLAVLWLAPVWSRAAAPLACAGLAAIAIAYFPVADESLETSLEPRLALDQLSTLALPGEREEAHDEAMVALRAGYALDPAITERIGGEPVDARPWEIALIWAYGLDWHPLPVLQDYSAYTPELDRIDARGLASPDGPRFMLRHLGYDGSSLVGIDGRLTVFDSPLALRELLCGFSPVITTDRYQLLERAGDRCGAERPLGTVTAAYGEEVAVPSAGEGEAVFARIDGAGGDGIERARTFAYREAMRTVTLNGTTTTRFEPTVAPGGILLSVPPGADLPPPFGVGLDVDTIAIDSEGGLATSDGPLRIEFVAVPIGPAT